MAHHNISPLKKESLRLVGRGPELRNPVTGLPEQSFYRPPDPKNVRAAKNALGVIFVCFLVALPFWLGLAQMEWSHLLQSVNRVVTK